MNPENQQISFVQLPKAFPDNDSLYKDETLYILSLFEDSRGMIWVGTYRGLFRINRAQDLIDYAGTDPSTPYSLSDRVVWKFFEDCRGDIWIGTNKGINIYHQTEELQFEQIASHYDISRIQAWAFAEWDSSLVIIGTNLGVLYVDVQPDLTYSWGPFRDQSDSITADYFIYHILLDQQRKLWVGTWKNGIKTYHVKQHRLEEHPIRFAENNRSQLPIKGNIAQIFEDQHQNIWFASPNGLERLSLDDNLFFTLASVSGQQCALKQQNITAIVEDAWGYMWIGSREGLFKAKKKDLLDRQCIIQQFKAEEGKKHRLQSNLIYGLTIDLYHRLWISTYNGLFMVDLAKQEQSPRFISIINKKLSTYSFLFSVNPINKYQFWLSTYTSLSKLTVSEHLDAKAMSHYGMDLNRTDALANSTTYVSEFDSEGNLWIGTFNGLSKMISDTVAGSFQNFFHTYGQNTSLSNNTINDIFRDQAGQMWIGTAQGLNLYKAQGEESRQTFQVFGIGEGLPDEYIHAIEEDSKGNLWLSTNQGLLQCRYDAEASQLKLLSHITLREGLADNTFNNRALYIDKEDRIFLGSQGGLSIWNEHYETLESIHHQVVIHDFAVIREDKNNGKESIFVSQPKAIQEKAITLEHNENSIQIRFASLDLSQPENNLYRYQIPGVQDHWIDIGNTAELRLFKLSPGTYEMHIDGSNHRGMWSDCPAKLQVKVLPPFWETPFAYCVYVCIFFTGLYLFYRYRLNQKVRKLKEEAQLQQALMEEREQLRQENAADFHDELGNKITKISLFLELAERSLRNDQAPDSWLGKIRDNVTELASGFKDLLWVIDPHHDSLFDTFLRLKDFGEDLFENTDITFRTKGLQESFREQQLGPQIRKQVMMIFKEAMNNSLKYAKASNTELNIEWTHAQARISFWDDGKGFDLHQLEQKNGGRGLRNMIHRSELIGAKISLRSEPDKGTQIILENIPTNASG